ncbi:hypothetical protein AALK14_13530 [Butyricimonas hominis]
MEGYKESVKLLTLSILQGSGKPIIIKAKQSTPERVWNVIRLIIHDD